MEFSLEQHTIYTRMLQTVTYSRLSSSHCNRRSIFSNEQGHNQNGSTFTTTPPTTLTIVIGEHYYGVKHIPCHGSVCILYTRWCFEFSLLFFTFHLPPTHYIILGETQSRCLSAVLNLSMKIYWICASCEMHQVLIITFEEIRLFSAFRKPLRTVAVAAVDAVVLLPSLSLSLPAHRRNMCVTIKSHQRKGLQVPVSELYARTHRISHTHTRTGTHGNNNLFCIWNSFNWIYYSRFLSSLLVLLLFYNSFSSFALSFFLVRLLSIVVVVDEEDDDDDHLMLRLDDAQFFFCSFKAR